ncbi:hypothetical protein K432DRAFT_425768 [Lepidopterella palustris CBS 459.81]|uniref:Uncharacterized protein n=1 Tax=Lepidopterella palustris CBS 459.81 TaxID=1314670 RepID=A0A8E2EB88_9PEZI|nr:hypothetical protein K432DRAFT_425768 [Lepidopterella palustris CBS 459.81]
MATHRPPRSLNHLPPSPPPSPPKYHERHKKHSNDPLFNLSFPPTQPPSPPCSTKEQQPQERESFLTRVIISPLLFISFLISLFLINRRDRLARVNSRPHPSRSSTLISYLSLTAWVDPEPYQDPPGLTWQIDQGNSTPDALRPSAGQEGQVQHGWFLRKKHRAMAKLQLEDAFEMRGRVLAAMVGLALLQVGGVIWGVLRLWNRLRGE